jgi:hypothetical protein
MNATIKRKLILSLIKDHLVHNKLVRGLNAAGLENNLYFLRLGETVFILMGFGEDRYSDGVYEHYLKLFDKADRIDISNGDEALDGLVIEIYEELMKRKAG